ncbi:MAG TPA: ATP-binding protein [Anaerolineae bacterium]|nr:ATP-binding protein [Anaerolineae bacterium]HOQ99932.1 ATP-binding protein [Anaerolineae bacterium]HPL26839.1 ATP-binding protein [Anaerolineae bacterium]
MRAIPFWLKLLSAFLAVIIVAVGGVAILVHRSASTEFAGYVNRGRMDRAALLAPAFEDYYRQTGSWAGSERLASSLPMGQGMHGMGRGPGVGMAGQLVVADPSGHIVAGTDGALLGKRLSPADLQYGVPLTVDGRLQGYLLAGEFSDQPASLEAEFLARLNQALLVAALLAGGAALLLALLLSRGLSGPLAALAGAARQLAAGERGLRVAVAGSSELALLGCSFNSMAEALEKQEGLRRQLLADIAHELRTPLAVIRGNLEALLDGIYRPSAETIAPIHEEALLLTRLVDDLRDLALAEAGQLPLHLAEVDLLELARGVLSGFAAQANERSIALELLLPEVELPAAGVDAGRIRQVLANLLANALRYTPQRGRVQLSLRQPARDWLQVCVSDNGPGISPEDLPHVFDRFYRGDRARTHVGSGSGLGLAIARQWVEAHGGHIRAESTLGAGTTFSFTVPVQKLGS